MVSVLKKEYCHGNKPKDRKKVEASQIRAGLKKEAKSFIVKTEQGAGEGKTSSE